MKMEQHYFQKMRQSFKVKVSATFEFYFINQGILQYFRIDLNKGL